MWDLAGGTGVWRQTTDEDVIKNLKLEGDSLIVSINFSRIKLVLKFESKVPRRSRIFATQVYNFSKMKLLHGCSPVNLLHIFRTPFTKNTSEGLCLRLTHFMPLVSFSNPWKNHKTSLNWQENPCSKLNIKALDQNTKCFCWINSKLTKNTHSRATSNESFAPRCSVKKVFLNISQNSLENNNVIVSFKTI